MAGLEPGIHVFVAAKQDVDARLKAGTSTSSPAQASAAHNRRENRHGRA
jgi:hypothetical protein